MKRGLAFALTALLSVASGKAWATVTAQGAVVALTDINQMTQITGTATFQEGPPGTSANASTNSAEGLNWVSGLLVSALNGVTTPGSAFFPQFQTAAMFNNFPNCGNGAVQAGQINIFAGVATFTVPVTQVGLTASTNGDQYLTAWNTSGVMIGQVHWQPNASCSFVGIDTQGVLIGMIAYGNDDLWAGQTYDIGGATIISDTWLWGPGVPPPPCAVNSDCDDGNPCNGVETCDPMKLVCVHPGAPACDDMNVCTIDLCDPMVGCVHTPNPGLMCDDGDTCTNSDQCDNSGKCGGTPIDCNDNNGCTSDACDSMTGCTHAPMAGACDDLNPCTDNDQCTGGTCAGTMLDCDDKNPCTDDACDASMGCVHTPNMATCDDGNACTTSDRCSQGTCSGADVACDDKNDCTSDSCDPTSGCKHDAIMGCMTCIVNGKSVDCDDKDVCTKDTCGTNKCNHAHVDGCCHKDADCDGDLTCDVPNHTCQDLALPAKKSGCSCEAPGEAPGSNGGWVGLGLLAIAAVSRRAPRTRRGGRRS